MWGCKCNPNNLWWRILTATMIPMATLELVRTIEEVVVNLNLIYLLTQLNKQLKDLFLILKIQLFQLHKSSSLLRKALSKLASTAACWPQLLRTNTKKIQILLKASRIPYLSTKKLLFEQDPKRKTKDHLWTITAYHKSTENGCQIIQKATIIA